MSFLFLFIYFFPLHERIGHMVAFDCWTFVVAGVVQLASDLFFRPQEGYCLP